MTRLCAIALIVASIGVFGCGATGTPSATGAPARRTTWPPIGTNLNGPSYWSTQVPFLDVFKTTSPWISGTRDIWDDRGRLDLDARGWVKSLRSGQVANKALFTDTVNFSTALASRYAVTYEGTGRLEYGELASVVERGNHRDLIAIQTGKGNATITLTSTDPANYLRNIRILPERVTPGPGEIFNPIFIERLGGYRALRFMGWILGDSSEDIAPRTWNARPVPDDAVWTIKGVPAEIMIALESGAGRPLVLRAARGR